MGVRLGRKAQHQWMGICSAITRDDRTVWGPMEMVSARQSACKGGPWPRANEGKRVRDGVCSLSKRLGQEGALGKRQEDLTAVDMTGPWESG